MSRAGPLDETATATGKGLFAEVRVRADTDASSAVVLSNDVAPLPAPISMLERLAYWAGAAPDRVFLEEREGEGWRGVTYAEAWAATGPIGARLLSAELGPERPLAIISPNCIAHAVTALAAMRVGIPVAPLFPPAWDEASQTALDERLRLISPGAVAVSPSAIPPIVRSALSKSPFRTIGLDLDVDVGSDLDLARVDDAARAVTPDSPAKLLFTSGSTGGGRPVVNTHGMLASNQAALAQVWLFLAERPPRLTDWLPWRHTFGGNVCFNLALFHGGTFSIDDGGPLNPARTVENLKTRPPSIFFNVPAGYEALLPHIENDADFARGFLGGLDLLFNAGAALPESTHARLCAVARTASGREVPIIGSWGLTETAPAATMVWWPDAEARDIGAPLPGVSIKLAPEGGRLELRVKGPNVTPGYWGMPDATAEAFDHEGWLKTGDAGRLADPERPERGLIYDGRIAENFKLLTGSWVNAEAVRLATIDAAWPLVSNAVVAGLNRDQVGVLLFLNLDACRNALGSAAEGLTDEAVRCEPAILARLRLGFAAHNVAQAGASRKICRFLVLETPPDAAAGEVTAKGSLNQAVLLERRAADVERLYAKGFEVA